MQGESSGHRFQSSLVLLAAMLVASTLSGAAWSQASGGHSKKNAQRQIEDTTSPTVAGSPGSNYYALVIGNNDYKYVAKLKTAVNDANSIAELLRENFGFTTNVLTNATRNRILTALNEYRRTLPEDSNLLIYYAGHGHHDPDTEKAYWLPVDAQSDNNENWISADDITSDVKAIPSQHVLIISDSCYSGVLTRAAEVEITSQQRGTYLTKMMQSKSRNLMSSGGDEPVADGGAPGHSIFAAAILESFQRIDQDQFTAADIFHRFIQPGVAGRSDQVPQYTLIKNSGHAFGDFVFSRRTGFGIAKTAGNLGTQTGAGTVVAPASSPGSVSPTYSGGAQSHSAASSPESSTPGLLSGAYTPQLSGPQPSATGVRQPVVSTPVDTSTVPSFAVVHFANAGVDFNQGCIGWMTVESGMLRFHPVVGNDGMHSFDFPAATVKEVKKNALVGINFQAFHVRLTSGEVYNFSVVDPTTFKSYLNADALLLAVRTRLGK